MRGADSAQQAMFSYVSLESRVPTNHPLRTIRRFTNQTLRDLSDTFNAMYSTIGRPSIPPERLLRALIVQILFSVRSERLLMEQLQYNLLYRWFVGLEIDDPVWDPTVFTKNRDRLLASDVAQLFLDREVMQARQAGLLSDEHFSVDGTLIEAWASMKSFLPKDDGGAPLRAPGQADHRFRRHAVHRFRAMPSTCSGRMPSTFRVPPGIGGRLAGITGRHAPESGQGADSTVESGAG